MADPKIGDRVQDVGGLVGTVTEWWRDDQGVWVEVTYDDSAGLLGEDFTPYEDPAPADSGEGSDR